MIKEIFNLGSDLELILVLELCTEDFPGLVIVTESYW